MKKEVNYIIENEIITNVENEKDFIELFNKKLATIILNLENELRAVIPIKARYNLIVVLRAFNI